MTYPTTEQVEKARQVSLADFLFKTDMKPNAQGTNFTLKAMVVYT